MKKLMKIIGLILPLMGGLHAAETSIIPGASYYVAHPTDDQSNPNVIIFRDYQGRDLKEDKEVWKSRLHMDMQLDANALKPQPVDCEVAWWEARPIGNGHTIGTSGYYAYFKDSQGDIAKIMRFDLEKNLFLEIVKSPQSASGIKMIYRKLNELDSFLISTRIPCNNCRDFSKSFKDPFAYMFKNMSTLYTTKVLTTFWAISLSGLSLQ